MAEDERACWTEFVSHAPANVLTSGDRVALEATARLIGGRLRVGPRRFAVPFGQGLTFVARGGVWIASALENVVFCLAKEQGFRPDPGERSPLIPD
jgi:hypothetical protein